MARGRPPKPAEVKRREGNPGKRAIQQPIVVSGRVVTPDNLPTPPLHLDERGQALFTEYVNELVGAGIFDLSDTPALEAMCEAQREAENAYAVLQREGHTVRGYRSTLVVHPAYKVWRDSRTIWLRYAEQFALTPSARARLGLAGLMGRKLSDELKLPPHPRANKAKA
jgi:P27 family predicted phage terminase small subunit